MKIKRFIDIHVPISSCNLKCKYCYVGQENNFNSEKTVFEYSPKEVKKALSVERLGGVCHFNVCGIGETLIPEELFDYVVGILENGHTVMIVTNGTLTKRIKQYYDLSEDLKSRLGFKFSFHYLELIRLNLLDTFVKNVNETLKSGISISVEITANDDYEPYIDEIMEFSMREFGALPHISVPRNMKDGLSLLSRNTKDEFYRIWSVFDSKMFEFKIKHWEEKRKEYCYAGDWSFILNLGNGYIAPCYGQRGYSLNLFDNIEYPLDLSPVGKCKIKHCYNAHSFLTFGDILEIDECRYISIRDRVTTTGKHWINGVLAEQFSSRLIEENKKYTGMQKLRFKFKRKKILAGKVLNKVFNR